MKGNFCAPCFFFFWPNSRPNVISQWCRRKFLPVAPRSRPFLTRRPLVSCVHQKNGLVWREPLWNCCTLAAIGRFSPHLHPICFSFLLQFFFAAPPAAVRLFFRTKSHSCFYTFLAARRKYFQPETRRIVKSNLKIFSFFSNNKFINLKSVEWTTLFKTRCAHRLNLNGFYRPLSRKGKGSVATLRLRKKFIGFWLLLSLMSIANRFRILDALGGKFEYSNDWENVLKEPGIKFK